ncbi:hypothetical protein ACFQ0G_05865 [Streptomyces chiangmaiensis]
MPRPRPAAGALLEELCSSAVAIIPAGEQSDDVAVLLARSHSLDPDQVMEWELAADAAAVGGVRAAAVRTLTDWRLERLVPAAEQIIGELLANAVLHAAGPVRLRLIRYQVLVCEVFDRSLHIVRAGNAGPTDEGAEVSRSSPRSPPVSVPDGHRTASASGPSCHCPRRRRRGRNGLMTDGAARSVRAPGPRRRGRAPSPYRSCRRTVSRRFISSSVSRSAPAATFSTR